MTEPTYPMTYEFESQMPKPPAELLIPGADVMDPEAPPVRVDPDDKESKDALTPEQAIWVRDVLIPWWRDNVVAMTKDAMTDERRQLVRKIVNQMYRDIGYPEPELHYVQSPTQMFLLGELTYASRLQLKELPENVRRKHGMPVSEVFEQLTASTEFREQVPWMTDEVVENARLKLAELVDPDTRIIPNSARARELGADSGFDLLPARIEFFYPGNMAAIFDLCLRAACALFDAETPFNRVGPWRPPLDLAQLIGPRYNSPEFCLISELPLRADPAFDSDDGPAWEWEDGTKFWYIETYPVDQKIVMQPQDQTVEEILDEENEEIRRIRLDRYGWERFLRKTDAELLDSQVHEQKDRGIELLFHSERLDMTVLVVTDGSTSRQYGLPVDSGIRTCRDAQAFLNPLQDTLKQLGMDWLEVRDVYPINRS